MSSSDSRSTIAPFRRQLQRDVLPPPELKRAEAQYFVLGRDYAPLFVGWVDFILAAAQRGGHRRIYYFTREGEFFAALHRQIQAARPQPRLPAAVVLEVSRRATFLPALRRVTIEGLLPVWRRYPRQTPAALLATLNLDIEALRPQLAAHALTADTPLERPWEDARVVALLADPQFQTIAHAAAARQRADLLDYLSQHGLSPHTPRAAVVDIGWHGTIQDNLARLLPTTTWEGYYFGLQRDGRMPRQAAVEIAPPPAPPNVVRRSFIGEVIAAGHDEALQHAFLKFVGPLEMLTNSPHGTTAGYRRRDGQVVAVRRNSPAEDSVFHERIRHFQAGVLAAAPHVTAMLTGAEPGELRRHYWRLLRTLMLEPPRPIAQAHAALHHDETFGLGQLVAMQQQIPLGLSLRAAFSAADRAEFRRWLYATPWPQGFLVSHNLGWFCRWLNWRYFRVLYHGRHGTPPPRHNGKSPSPNGSPTRADAAH